MSQDPFRGQPRNAFGAMNAPTGSSQFTQERAESPLNAPKRMAVTVEGMVTLVSAAQSAKE